MMTPKRTIPAAAGLLVVLMSGAASVAPAQSPTAPVGKMASIRKACMA